MLATKIHLNTLALDVGEQRVGIALAHADVRVPVPLQTLKRQDTTFWRTLAEIIAKHQVKHVVVGLPRGLDGQETDQTKLTRAFVDELAIKTGLPIDLQDEALTSVRAEAELQSRGSSYNKGDIDALAASFILADYLEMEK